MSKWRASIWRRLAGLRAPNRLFVAATLAVGTYFWLAGLLPPDTKLVVSWDVFATALLALSAITFWQTTTEQIEAVAKRQDENRTIISITVVLGALASLTAIPYGMNAHSGPGDHHVAWALLAVSLSWPLIHTTFCFKYAHLYYQRQPRHQQPDAQAADMAGGIDFLGGEMPDYFDFAYFAFVIGMTAQVSDAVVHAKPIRRLVLVHSLISFAYNTIIIALYISVLSKMLS